jgi:putative sigma-54 modulation protein
MQKHNANPPITVTGRHVEITDAIRDYAVKKVEGLHLDYPRIIDAKVILEANHHHGRHHRAEIVLFCANHIVIEVHSTTDDLYASIDESIAKIARRMRKFKTRMLKNPRPRKGSVKHVQEHVYHEEAIHSEAEELTPSYVHKEQYRIRPLFADEAILELEMSNTPFVVFHNQQSHRLAIMFRRKDGDYGLIEPDVTVAGV